MTPLSVVLADDHVLVRAGLRSILETIDGVEVVGEAGDGHEALRLVEEQKPHLAILDISMPGMNGIEVAVRVRTNHPGTRVLVLSMHVDGEYVRRALRAGAAGYLVKDAGVSELEMAIQAVTRGESYLSPAVSTHVIEEFVRGPSPEPELTSRQREILQLVAEGHSTKEIAHRLIVAVKTVESHRSQIMDRLGIHDVPGLVRYAVRIGLVTSEA